LDKQQETKMKVWEQAIINGMSLANRFVRSATWEGLATADSYCSPELTQLLVRLAKGGVGLIITSHTTISPEGQAGIRQVGIWSDDFIPKLALMTDQVHAAGGKIVMQINHAGIRAVTQITKEAAMGPSLFKHEDGTVSRTMEKSDIRNTVEKFAAAALRAKTAGFDGIQVHAAHGYLLSSFLSPYFNQRRDEYGGAVENRARFLLEVLQAVFAAVGDNFPVLVKMNAADFLPGGFTAQDMVQTAALLEEAGVDAIELSGGTNLSGKLVPFRPGKITAEKEGYYQEEALKYKERIAVPLILVGGFRSLTVSEKFLREGICDFIALSRPLIREPELIARWKSGDTSEATCISDNLCFIPTREGKGIYCVTREKLQETS
jgi:2,4-dienoyl-CoA reductase-like NADH-dependent reductase (Old Yellow Enzyme family)